MPLFMMVQKRFTCNCIGQNCLRKLSKLTLLQPLLVTLFGSMDEVEAQVVVDLQENSFLVDQFKSSCSTNLEGNPKNNKTLENWKPKNNINVENGSRYRFLIVWIYTGSLGLEDVWQTKNYIFRQLAVFLSFTYYQCLSFHC